MRFRELYAFESVFFGITGEVSFFYGLIELRLANGNVHFFTNFTPSFLKVDFRPTSLFGRVDAGLSGVFAGVTPYFLRFCRKDGECLSLFFYCETSSPLSSFFCLTANGEKLF